MLQIGTIGTIGMLCIVAAWIPQTIRTIKTKIVGMEPKFLWLYFLGSAFLTVYAIAIADVIFTILNFIAAALGTINIYYYYKYEVKMKKKKVRAAKKI